MGLNNYQIRPVIFRSHLLAWTLKKLKTYPLAPGKISPFFINRIFDMLNSYLLTIKFQTTIFNPFLYFKAGYLFISQINPKEFSTNNVPKYKISKIIYNILTCQWWNTDKQNAWPWVCVLKSVSKPKLSIAGINALMVYRGEPGTGASCVTWPL